MLVKDELRPSGEGRTQGNFRQNIRLFVVCISMNNIIRLDDGVKIYRYSVDHQQINLRVRYTQRFDHILDRGTPVKCMFNRCVPLRTRQKKVQLIMDMKSCVGHGSYGLKNFW